MNTIDIIFAFLQELPLDRDTYAFRDKLGEAHDPAGIDASLAEGKIALFNILTDTYALNSEKVKKCAESIAKKYSAIGRYEKELIKHYLDYGDAESVELLASAISNEDADTATLFAILNKEKEDLSRVATERFIENWNKAVASGDSSKLHDYIQGLYSRLNAIFGSGKLSLLDIYEYNAKFIAQELAPAEQAELSDFCKSNKQLPENNARALFSQKYGELLSKALQRDSNENRLEKVMNRASGKGTPFEKYDTESFGLVFINIDQLLYDNSENEVEFYDRVLSLLYHSYRVLDNHHALAINIDNIYTKQGKNLKWLLYSYIGIYAEHFIPTVEHRKFYRPEQLSFDKCEYLGIELTAEQKNALSGYYAGTLDMQALRKILDVDHETLSKLLLDFDKVWYGYTFSDCIAVRSGSYPQDKEISFIENCCQIVLVFNKYRHDDRKIPCPDCAGLEISGNSFPEIALRSWECKNPLCPSRSKSNRGKRYSKKSNFMQLSFESGRENDQISRELIKLWRRDIADIASKSDIYDMLVKYYSFDQDNVLFVNSDVSAGAEIKKLSRVPHIIQPEQIYKIQALNGEFKRYFHGGDYINRYLDQHAYIAVQSDGSLNQALHATSGAMLIHGNSRDILSKIDGDTFTAAVTSPPYYNARLYSQWENLYLYLSDMYDIIKETYRTLKPGGIYLYNIGDICGNENTVVRSNMGNKRILLGAYTINLFINAGFELLDNILWDKGNPQSNRQKNDGKFTPYYQKPMNVYEHMFIFKKPGASAIVSENAIDRLPIAWKTNIAPFSPVIKINCKGENTLGHTAPFPEDIPAFVAKVFTRSPDDIVLDPFAGSGTTLIACSKCGVSSLGIELCEEYTDLISDIGKDNGIEINKL